MVEALAHWGVADAAAFLAGGPMFPEQRLHRATRCEREGKGVLCRFRRGVQATVITVLRVAGRFPVVEAASSGDVRAV